MYTIKTVTSLTGINTETLRAWERRYGAVEPLRDDKGRRLYTQQDIERLSLLCAATRQGFSISKIADLNNQELQELLAANQEPHKAIQDMFFIQVIEALTQFRMDDCEELLRRALIAMPPLCYARDVLMPTLNKVGNLWHEGKLSIVQEHMFSACVKRIVLSMVNNLQPFSGPNPAVMFATLSGEKHEFGILLTCLLAASQRCLCYYIGPDLPWEELLKAGAQLKPAVIILSSVNTPPDANTIQSLKSLAESLDKNIRLWIGGLGAKYLHDKFLLPEPWLFIPSMDDFYSQIQHLISTK